MSNKLITFGCSHTKDNYQKTWADYLAELIDLPLVNLGARGAGLDYISKRIINYDLKNTDLVVIMLPSADRFDWYIDNDSPLQKDALSIASWQNGKNPCLADLNGNLSNESGFVLSGGEHRGAKKYWYKYFYSETKADLDYWHYAYLIQLHLNSVGCEYYFTSAYDKDRHVEQNLNKNISASSVRPLPYIDFNKFIYWKLDKGFLTFVQDQKYQVIKNHPETEAHKEFASYLREQLSDS